jgi:hypothetical protein
MTKPITDFPATPIYFVKFDNVGLLPQIKCPAVQNRARDVTPVPVPVPEPGTGTMTSLSKSNATDQVRKSRVGA